MREAFLKKTFYNHEIIHLYSTKFRQIGLQILPPGGHLGKPTMSYITPEIMAGSTPNFNHRYQGT
jgi:hypothetical protein